MNFVDGSAELLSKTICSANPNQILVLQLCRFEGNPALQATNDPWRRRPDYGTAGMHFADELLSTTSFRSRNPNRILGFSAESRGTFTVMAGMAGNASTWTWAVPERSA